MFAIFVCIFVYVGQYMAADNATCKHWFATHMYQTKDFDYYGTFVVRIKYRNADDLKINCTNPAMPDQQITILSMYPEKSGRMLFNNDFYFKQLVASFNFSEIRRVSYHNLHGFISMYPYALYQLDNLFVCNSKFDFYLNETTLITRELCVLSNFNQSGVFTGLTILYMHNTDYSMPVCPYVF